MLRILRAEDFLPIPSHGHKEWRLRDLPCFRTAPIRICPTLRPRRNREYLLGGFRIPDTTPARLKAEASALFFRGSITQLLRSLSTLHTPGHPSACKTRFRLLYQSFVDRDSYPAGCKRSFNSSYPLLTDFQGAISAKLSPLSIKEEHRDLIDTVEDISALRKSVQPEAG